MSDEKLLLSLTAAAAASAVICVVAMTRRKKNVAKDKLSIGKDAWKHNTPERFTGWLARLKVAIGEEIKQSPFVGSEG